MPQLIWSPASRDDLKGIDEYMMERDPVVALEILRAIRSTAIRLLEYPRIGRAIEEPYRVLGARGTPYLVIYRLRDGVIEIVRVRHARENWLDNPEGIL